MTLFVDNVRYTKIIDNSLTLCKCGGRCSKIFVGEGEAPQKKTGPTPIRTTPPRPLEEKNSKEEPPNDEKVAIAPPPWAPAGGGARVGGCPPLENLKKRLPAIWGAFLLLFLHVEAFSATFMGDGGLFNMHVGAFSDSPPLRKFLRAPKAPPHSHLSFVKRVVISILVFDKQFDAI